MFLFWMVGFWALKIVALLSEQREHGKNQQNLNLYDSQKKIQSTTALHGLKTTEIHCCGSPTKASEVQHFNSLVRNLKQTAVSLVKAWWFVDLPDLLSTQSLSL